MNTGSFESRIKQKRFQPFIHVWMQSRGWRHLPGGLLALATLLCGPPDVQAGTAGVPFGVQVQLFVKIMDYNRSLADLPEERRVLLLVRNGSVESEQAAVQLRSKLALVPTIAGRPHSERIVTVDTVQAAAQLCGENAATILYLTPGLELDADKLGRALDRKRCLTVTAAPEQVREGVVLGFDLVSGKPKILINLGQARRQEVSFRSQLLQLAQVYR